jgi:hypothetical protein
VKEQAELLKRLDWWRHVQMIQSRSVAILGVLVTIPNEEFLKIETTERRPLLEAFLQIIPEISSQLGKITSGLDVGAHQFGNLWPVMEQYFDNGIVPSTINVDVGNGIIEQAHPSAVTIINAAFRYYLEKLDNLMLRIKNQDIQSIETRSYWINKVQSWAAKALEDVSLIEKINLW